MKKIYLITTGQSPREDISIDLKSLFSPEIEVFELGAMDAFSVEEVKTEFAAAPGEPTLVSRFRNGEMIPFSEEKGMPYVQAAIDRACDEGADLIIILCTGCFPQMRSSVPVLFPGKILHTIVPAVAMGMKAAYLFPFASHAEGMIRGWEEVGMPGEYSCYHPSSGDPESVAIDFLKSADPEIIVLDCIGYSSDFGKKVAAETGKSVILPRTLLVNIAHALLGL